MLHESLEGLKITLAQLGVGGSIQDVLEHGRLALGAQGAADVAIKAQAVHAAVHSTQQQRTIDGGIGQTVDDLLGVGIEVAGAGGLGDLLANDAGGLHGRHDSGALCCTLERVAGEALYSLCKGGGLDCFGDRLLCQGLGRLAHQLGFDLAGIGAQRIGGGTGEDRAELLATLGQRLAISTTDLAHLQVGVTCSHPGHVYVEANNATSHSASCCTR